MNKKITYVLILFLFLSACESMKSVKRGLTGEKKMTTDEFFVKKKDPLILPPDYENLPDPDESMASVEETSIFEKVLETSSDEETSSSESRSTENSILRKIQSK